MDILIAFAAVATIADVLMKFVGYLRQPRGTTDEPHIGRPRRPYRVVSLDLDEINGHQRCGPQERLAAVGADVKKAHETEVNLTLAVDTQTSRCLTETVPLLDS